MAKRDKARGGITRRDMEAYKDLARGVPDPFSPGEVRGPEAHPSAKSRSSRELHGHVGPVNHIKIIDCPGTRICGRGGGGGNGW